ncbi:MAG: MBL fold metallo-hydrolase [Ruminococcaceae bacterium]|nr:MBL fold metallo-hydrolase [Oscillospiraceae bacterium]
MQKIDNVILGTYENNCYIVRDEASPTCILVDPSCDAPCFLEKTQKMGLTIEAILLTHGHFDHVLAVKEIAEKTGCPVWMHKGDHHPETGAMLEFFYPLSKEELSDVRYCDEGDVLHLAGLEITVLATPGHTNGSVCYQFEDILITGDTLFAGSIGRTDLPGGSYQTIQASLSRLAALEENYHILPGHGEESDLATEKRHNPYLRGM